MSEGDQFSGFLIETDQPVSKSACPEVTCPVFNDRIDLQVRFFLLTQIFNENIPESVYRSVITVQSLIGTNIEGAVFILVKTVDLVVMDALGSEAVLWKVLIRFADGSIRKAPLSVPTQSIPERSICNALTD